MTGKPKRALKQTPKAAEAASAEVAAAVIKKAKFGNPRSFSKGGPSRSKQQAYVEDEDVDFSQETSSALLCFVCSVLVCFACRTQVTECANIKQSRHEVYSL